MALEVCLPNILSCYIMLHYIPRSPPRFTEIALKVLQRCTSARKDVMTSGVSARRRGTDPCVLIHLTHRLLTHFARLRWPLRGLKKTEPHAVMVFQGSFKKGEGWGEQNCWSWRSCWTPPSKNLWNRAAENAQTQYATSIFLSRFRDSHSSANCRRLSNCTTWKKRFKHPEKKTNGPKKSCNIYHIL